MIDTVKFRIPVDESLYNQIRSKGESNIIRDYVNKEQWIRYMKAEVELGSYDRHITLFSYDESCVYLECSLPKQYKGENVTLLFPSELILALEHIHTSLIQVFPTFPSYKDWRIVRLDICYAWRLSTELQSTRILDMLKHLEYPRKFRYVYKTAVMFKGHHYSIKFYLKHPEFIRHDFKTLHEKDPEKAMQIYESSKNVVRFEITYRKEQLKHLFEKSSITYKDLLDEKFFETEMNDKINKLLQNRNTESMTDDQIVFNLKKVYKPDKAMRLFNFYKQYYSDKEYLKQLIKDNYHPSTIWRNRRDIVKANVGISNNTIDFDFNLSIPSDLAVTHECQLPR